MGLIESFLLEITKRCKIAKTNIMKVLYFENVLGKENEILVLTKLHLFVIYLKNTEFLGHKVSGSAKTLDVDFRGLSNECKNIYTGLY